MKPNHKNLERGTDHPNKNGKHYSCSELYEIPHSGDCITDCTKEGTEDELFLSSPTNNSNSMHNSMKVDKHAPNVTPCNNSSNVFH